MKNIELEDLEKEDKILFSDRKQPLKVSKTEQDRVLVEGPSGGEYEIYRDNETVLWCKEGNRRYSSYCKNLRKVGKWERTQDTWKHSSGTKIRIEKTEIGYWTIKADGIEINEQLDLPKYGYSDKEKVEKEVEKVVRKNPEG